MKKKVFFYLFSFIVALFAIASCKHNNSTVGKLVIKFDTAKVKITRTDLSSLNEGDEVKEGEKLIFSSIDIEDTQLVSQWIINDIALPNSGQARFEYNVNKNDAKIENSVGILNVSFDTTSSEKMVVKFSDDISCKDSISYMKKFSGDEVTEGQKLDFSASLLDGEACEGWYINGFEFPPSPVFQFVVVMKNAKLEDGVATFNVSFKKSKATNFIVRFDDNAIRAVDSNKKGVFNDDVVSNSDVITFTANIENAKAIDAWFVGDTKQKEQTSRIFVYTPNENDAVVEGSNKIITIKCEKRTSQKIRIDFNKDDIYTSSSIESGTMVDEGTFIIFNSKFTANSYAPTWYINDKVQPRQSLGGDSYYDNFIQTFKYTVDIKDAIDDAGVKVIKVSYKTQNTGKQITLKFPDDVQVIIPGVGNVSSGTQVSCGEDLGIQAKYGFEGENSNQKVALESWFINGKKVGYPKVFINPTIFSTGGSALAYIYKVVEEDVDENGVINITYTTHERKDISIEFDSSSILAFKGSATAKIPITSGTLIKEDTFLSFQKIDNDEYFDENFYFNGKKWETILSSDLYLLNAKDAVEENGIYVLRVTAKTRPKKQVKVVWNDPNMTCRIRRSSITSGQTVAEGSNLIFEYKLTDTSKIIRGFFTDGKDDSHILARNGSTDKVEGCFVKVLLEYCKKEGGEYVLHPRFQIDTKEMVTIKVGSAITCTNVDNGSSVTDGMQVLEGTTLRFQASAAEVHKWIVGIKEIHGGRTLLPNPSVWCVNKEWAKREGGAYVAQILFE